MQEIVEGYVRSAATKPLVVVGSAPYSAEYTDRIDGLPQGDERVRLLGAVWDQELLDDLYASAFTYVHGHSVGGTNPSLLHAISAGATVIAFDVDFNREVVRDPGLYFRGPHDLAGILEDAERDELGTIERGRANRKRAEDYSWDDVAEGYERLARDLVARDGRAVLACAPCTVDRRDVASGRRDESYRATVVRLATAQKVAARSAPAYSRFVNRRLGRLLAAWAYRAGLSPNAVTAVSAGFAFSAVVLLAVLPPTWWLGITVAHAPRPRIRLRLRRRAGRASRRDRERGRGVARPHRRCDRKW